MSRHPHQIEVDVRPLRPAAYRLAAIPHRDRDPLARHLRALVRDDALIELNEKGA